MKRSSAAEFVWEKNQKNQLKQEGTGTPDTSKFEWRVQQKRETIATILLLPGLLSYQATALGQSEAETRFSLMESMVQPCGPEPKNSQ
jgi:splicing factor 3B subunit 5